jgi:predicted HTH domain antitoxin
MLPCGYFFFEETTIISIELYVESLDILETLNELIAYTLCMPSTLT